MAANSPHFLETAGLPEPLCIKSTMGKYVGSMVDGGFEFKCRIDDRCTRKFLDIKLAEEIEKLKAEATAQTKKAKEAPAQQASAQSYITKVNGSVIIRIG